jgi:AcrR family transcriptional regulator
MPAPGDHEARRRDVSQAVWRVLAARGFGGLRLRAVAAEMGASTGLLTYYFPDKRSLLAYALDLLEQRTLERPRRPAADAEGALRDAMLDLLPLDDDAVARSRIWVGSWDEVLADAGLAAGHDRRYARGREGLQRIIEDARAAGALPAVADAADLAASVQGFCLGLTVQALVSPTKFPPERQISLVDGFLSALLIQRPRAAAHNKSLGGLRLRPTAFMRLGRGCSCGGGVRGSGRARRRRRTSISMGARSCCSRW